VVAAHLAKVVSVLRTVGHKGRPSGDDSPPRANHSQMLAIPCRPQNEPNDERVHHLAI